MATGSVPSKDSQLGPFSVNFVAYAKPKLPSWGLTATALDQVEASLAVFQTNYNKHVTAQAGAKSACAAKDQGKKALQMPLRAIAKQLQSLPTVTDADRAAMGLHVRKQPQEQMQGLDDGPASRPVVEVQEVEGLRHVLKLTDSDNGAGSKPQGVAAAQIYQKIAADGTEAPVGPEEMRFMGESGSCRIIRTFTGEQTGQTAWYLFRWVGTRGQVGPWSNLVRATIAA